MNPNLTYYMLNENIECVYCRNSSISYDFHTHANHFTIGYIIDGQLQIKQIQTKKNKKELICQSGEFFLIKPDVLHSIETPIDSTCNFFCLCIESSYLLSIELESLLMILNEYLKSLDYAFSPNIFEDALTILYADLTGIFTDIPQSLKTDCNNPIEFTTQLKLKMLLAPQLPLSINQMAESICISPYHMIRKFKNEYGLTPHQFQIQSRIRQAQKLLEKNSVIEVAYATGFCDQSHFDRCFVKIVGLTPTAYKNSIQHIT